MSSPYDPKHTAIRAKIESYARKYGINPSIAVRQIWKESRFNPKAGSPKGARGIAQFIPGTAARFGVNVNDVDSSLDGYGKYMRFLLNRFKGDYSKALAGYNAGEGAVDKYKGVPPYKETRDYVATILGGGFESVTDTAAEVFQNVNLFGLGENRDNLQLSAISPETKRSFILVVAFVTVLAALVYAFK